MSTPTPTKTTDGTTVEARPRIADADWTWARIWTRYKFAIVTVINLTVFFALWQLAAVRLDWYFTYLSYIHQHIGCAQNRLDWRRRRRSS